MRATRTPESDEERAMFKLEYHVPAEHLEAVNQALFVVGAGAIGQYDCCCWVTEGTGQYRPLEGSNPYHGRQSVIEKVHEFKVEMVVENDRSRTTRWAQSPAPEIERFDSLRTRLVGLLDLHRGNIAAVARALDKDRMQIHRWMRRFALDLETFRR
jgi:hypothetical protein